MDRPLEQMLRHDRALLLAAIAAATLLAWTYIVWFAAGMEMPVSLNETMAPVIAPWSAKQFVLMWAMWVVSRHDEVADLVAWLTGPGAGHMSGASLTIDGGWTA